MYLCINNCDRSFLTFAKFFGIMCLIRILNAGVGPKQLFLVKMFAWVRLYPNVHNDIFFGLKLLFLGIDLEGSEDSKCHGHMYNKLQRCFCIFVMGQF